MLKSIALFLLVTLGLPAIAAAQQRVPPPAAAPPGTSGSPAAGSTHVDPNVLPPYIVELHKQIAALQAETKQQAAAIAALQKDVSGLGARFANHQHQPNGKCFVAKSATQQEIAVLSGAQQAQDVAAALAKKQGAPAAPAGNPC